ncbi:MAG TPA: MarR family winged helix-turn-helix transcriptional regulator [Chitinophagaceae bacterium]
MNFTNKIKSYPSSVAQVIVNVTRQEKINSAENKTIPKVSVHRTKQGFAGKDPINKLEKEIQQVKPFRNNYHKAAVNLIFTGKWMIQFHSYVFKKYNLTIQQYNILRILRGKYPVATTLKLIRERMLDRMSDASRIVELLRKKKMVVRNICGEDRRKIDIIITQKGLDLLEEIEKENERMDKHLSALNEEEIVLLNDLLDKVRG